MSNRFSSYGLTRFDWLYQSSSEALSEAFCTPEVGLGANMRPFVGAVALGTGTVLWGHFLVEEPLPVSMQYFIGRFTCHRPRKYSSPHHRHFFRSIGCPWSRFWVQTAPICGCRCLVISKCSQLVIFVQSNCLATPCVLMPGNYDNFPKMSRAST